MLCGDLTKYVDHVVQIDRHRISSCRRKLGDEPPPVVGLRVVDLSVRQHTVAVIGDEVLDGL